MGNADVFSGLIFDEGDGVINTWETKEKKKDCVRSAKTTESDDTMLKFVDLKTGDESVRNDNDPLSVSRD